MEVFADVLEELIEVEEFFVIGPELMQLVEFLFFAFLLFFDILAFEDLKYPMEPVELGMSGLIFLKLDEAWRVVIEVVEVLDKVVLNFIGPKVNMRICKFCDVLFHNISKILIELVRSLCLFTVTRPKFLITPRSKVLNLPIPCIPISLFHNIVAVDK
jgi:hypothetical protein